jgi:hypothetical protein
MKNMIESTFYLSDENNVPLALEYTDLSEDELLHIVGRFASHSSRKGQLRGEVVMFMNGNIKIRHHFTKKILWSKE